MSLREKVNWFNAFNLDWVPVMQWILIFDFKIVYFEYNIYTFWNIWVGKTEYEYE